MAKYFPNAVVHFLCFAVDFYWSDNSKVDYTYWNVNQPSDTLFGQLEECVEMFTDGSWNDVSCEDIRGFICKDSGTCTSIRNSKSFKFWFQLI